MVSAARAIERSADSVRVLHHFVGIVLLEIDIVHFYIAVAVVVVYLVPFTIPTTVLKSSRVFAPISSESMPVPSWWIPPARGVSSNLWTVGETITMAFPAAMSKP